jgi:HAD superfamily hydrolase (TIGR01458 family)
MTKGVLLDISGVLHAGDRAIPGAAEAVARLRDAGLPLRFLTNTTRRPRRVLLDKLQEMGFDVPAEALFTPATAARDALGARGAAPHLLIHPDLEEDFTDLPELGPDRAVVVGDAGRHFTFDTLNPAFRALVEGADFLALAANRSFRDDDGKLSMDAGAFVKALEYAAEVEATVLGKPAAGFYAAALESMGVPAQEAAMVGDDAEADVAGALRAGLGQAVLVRTGKYRDGDEGRVEPAPSHVADDLPAAVDWLLGS